MTMQKLCGTLVKLTLLRDLRSTSVATLYCNYFLTQTGPYVETTAGKTDRRKVVPKFFFFKRAKEV